MDQNQQMTLQDVDAIFGTPEAAPSASPPASTPPAPPAERGGVLNMAGRVLSDVGTGITELPGAVLKGVRDSAQETITSVEDLGEFAAGATGVGGLKPSTRLTLPDTPKEGFFAQPQSVTGGIAKSVSQFVVGMVGLNKLLGPAKTLGAASKGARFAAESAKAATVGAVAFDPQGPRLSNLIEENAPILSNPVTRYLAAQPGDSNAEGRLKNAIESIGMDIAIGGALMAAAKAARAMDDFKAGRINRKQLDKVLGEAATAGAPPPADATPTPAASAVDNATVPPPQEALPAGSEAPPAAVSDQAATPVAAAADAPPRVSEYGPELPANPLEVQQVDTAKRAMSIFEEGDLDKAIEAWNKDADAIATHGSWQGAIENGHNFAKGRTIPWQKMASEPDDALTNNLEVMIARVSDTVQNRMNQVRGGGEKGVQSDAQVRMMIGLRAKAWGDNPVALMGQLAEASTNWRKMAADMEAAFLLGQRAFADTMALNARIRAGDLSEFGGDQAAAVDALRKMMLISANFMAYGQSARAAAGRTMRRGRAEFAPSPEALEALSRLEPRLLMEVLENTKGNPKAFKKVMNPGLLSRLMDSAQYLMVNNLLWGWTTHAVNLTTSAYMVVGRPMERILGSVRVGGDEGARIRAQAVKHYAHLGAAMLDSFGAAKEAWVRGDSVLSPHVGGSEINRGTRLNAADFKFKPFDGTLGSLMHNALIVPTVKVIGTPTRALGVVDELIQQTTYRTVVHSNAHVEGVEKGLTGTDLTDFVKSRLMDAFDDAGRGTDLSAIQEARTTVFQQDLLAGTLGQTTQIATVRHPTLKFVVPFVKTPTNVLRYGWKMTPGLNLLQTEYRAMLRGEMGPDAMAQAYGQMAIGTLFYSYAAYLAAEGRITGGGPSDRNAREALMATGWRPYSFVIPNEDGTKTYVNFGRFDPVAMPFGLAADIVDAIQRAEGDPGTLEQVQSAAQGAIVGSVKQLTQKTYLRQVSMLLDALTDPDKNAARVGGQMATNFIPAVTALSMFNSDPYMREARDFTDRIMQRLPGESEKLPAKRNVFGEPVLANRGLWSTGERDFVDAEIARLADEHNVSLGSPSTRIGEVDLRDVTLSDGRNAYEVYQILSGKPTPSSPPLRDQIGRVMASAGYQKAPDGGADVRGTKMWIVTGIISKYREAALRQLKADPVLSEALYAREREVAGHYAAQRKAPEAKANSDASALQRLGEAFNIDLGTAP